VLPAFLAHHRALGVERAWIYVDRCADGTLDVLRAHDWIDVLPAGRRPAQPLEALQLACVDDAHERARVAGMGWLMHVDPDEFAWGGDLDWTGSACAAGSLTAMLARARPATEAVVLRTLEAVPVHLPAGTPFWRAHAMLTGAGVARDVLDPDTGEVVRLARCLGHFLGKSIVRVGADVQAATPHRWTRRQGVAVPELLPIVEETLGWHVHYVVRDAAHWHEKYRKFADDPDVWIRGNPVEFPKLGWKRAAPRMSAAEAAQYFDAWVAVPPAMLEVQRRAGTVVDVPVVERVLREIGALDAVTPRPRPVAARRRCRVAFIGLDAADPGLVRRWAAAGELPTLARLLDTTATAATDPPPGFFVGAIWPSWYTAVGPARHGVHCWQQLVPGTYDVVRWLAGREARHAPFWSALARAGRRVALIDVPLAGRTPGFDGVEVLEWGGHDPEEGFRAQPAALDEAIRRVVGMHPVPGSCNAWRDGDAIARFRDDLVAGIRRKALLHRLVLDRDDWDLFVTVYGESHCVGHQCWHVHDPSHVRHDPAVRARVGDPLLDVYRALDAGVADLLARLGDDCTVVVFLSHGMRPHDDPTFLLDDVLLRLEAAWRLGVERPLAHRLLGLGHALGRRVPALRARVERVAAGWRSAVAARATALAADRAGRAFFQVSNNEVDAAIRLNLRGREPAGLVAPGDEADRVCAALAHDLAALVDADTGAPLVARVVRTRDVHRGPHLDLLPDLWVEWRKGLPVRRVWSPLVGTIAREYAGVRTGDHTPEGLVMLRAAWAAPGDVGRRLPVVDLAPTLCALLDVGLEDVDGRPAPELLPHVAGLRRAG